jgi:hypothetical protein
MRLFKIFKEIDKIKEELVELKQIKPDKPKETKRIFIDNVPKSQMDYVKARITSKEDK